MSKNMQTDNPQESSNSNYQETKRLQWEVKKDKKYHQMSFKFF